MPRILVLIWQAIQRLAANWNSIDRQLAELRQNQREMLVNQRLMQEGLQQITLTLVHILDEITPEPAQKLIFSALIDDGRVLSGEHFMLNMSYTQKATLSLTAVDRKGNPAVLDGAPEWRSGNTDLVTIENVSKDGMSADVIATGALGTTTITVIADSKLGDEVLPIVGGLDVTITPGEATLISVSAGAPVEQE